MTITELYVCSINNGSSTSGIIVAVVLAAVQRQQLVQKMVDWTYQRRHAMQNAFSAHPLAGGGCLTSA